MYNTITDHKVNNPYWGYIKEASRPGEINNYILYGGSEIVFEKKTSRKIEKQLRDMLYGESQINILI